MKRTFSLLAAAILLLVAACQDGTVDTIFTIHEKNGSTILCGSDKPLIIGFSDIENEMPAELFCGSYDDNLLDSLLPSGASRSAINVFMVIDSLHTVLFDAGLGSDKGGRLLAYMEEGGMDPKNVTDVCLTHLHGDHIGGLLHDGQAAFPNATIHLSQEEYDAWSDNGPMAGSNGLWKQVMEAYRNRVEIFHDGDQLCDGMVVAHLAPGHTPGHTVFTVANICLMAGDLVHAQDLQLDHPQFCARYDFDTALATATRIRILDEVRTNGQYLAGAHCYDHFINLHDRSEKE